MASDFSNWLNIHGFTAAEPELTNDDGDPALVVAARQGRVDLIDHLLARGANPGCVDRYGNNALWAACYAESEACIRRLSDGACDLDHANPAGNTALAYAASSGKDKVVKLLLALGADPNKTNQDGMSPMDLASTLPCLKLLRAATKD